MPDLVSQVEAAAILGVSESKVARLRSTGRLAYLKLENGSIRLHRAHVQAMATRPTPSRITSDAAELLPNLLRPFLLAA
jgi:hypothetical protein